MMKVSVKCTSTKWLVPTGAKSISVSDEKCQCQPVSMLVRSVVRPSTPLEKSVLLCFVKAPKKRAYCPEGNPWYPKNFMVYLLFITKFPQISWCKKGWCRSSCRCGRNFDVLGYGFTSIVGSSKMDVFENGMIFSASNGHLLGGHVCKKPWDFDEFCGYHIRMRPWPHAQGLAESTMASQIQTFSMHQKIWGSRWLKGVSLCTFSSFFFGTFREPFEKNLQYLLKSVIFWDFSMVSWFPSVSGDGGALGDHGSASGSLFDSGSVSRKRRWESVGMALEKCRWKFKGGSQMLRFHPIFRVPTSHP